MNRTSVLIALTALLVASVAVPASATWTDDHFPLPAERGFSYLRDAAGEVIRTDPCTPSRWHVMDAKEAAAAKTGYVFSQPTTFRAPSGKVVRAVARGSRIVSAASGIPIIRGSRPGKDTYIVSTGIYEARVRGKRALTPSLFAHSDSWANDYYASARGESPHVRSGGSAGMVTPRRAPGRAINALGLRIALHLLGIDPTEGKLLTRNEQTLSATGKRAAGAVGNSPCHTKPLPATDVTATNWEWTIGDGGYEDVGFTLEWKQPVAGGEGFPQFTAVNSERGGQLDAWYADGSHDPFGLWMEEPLADWEGPCRSGTPRTYELETVGVYGLYAEPTKTSLKVHCPAGLREAILNRVA